MSSLYFAVIKTLGMSQEQAATFHNVNVNTIKHWSAGRRVPKQAIWDELRTEYQRQRSAAAALAAEWIANGSPALAIDTQKISDRDVADFALFVLQSPHSTIVTVAQP